MRHTAQPAMDRLARRLRRTGAGPLQLARLALMRVGLASRRVPPGDVVDAIRRHDLSGYSDSDLRHRLSELRESGERGGPQAMLPVVFALVDEAVSRRLGAWRLFDPDHSDPSVVRYRGLARRVLEDPPYKSQVGYYTDEGYLESPVFRGSIEPTLVALGLDDDDRTIVSTMVYVAEKSVVNYSAEVLLPSEFYRALASSDAGSALSFRATREQLLAGRLLYGGRIVEMNAGEGKTIAAAFPAVLHAVLGRRVHVITANDYLASRDAEWLAPVYESLGLDVRAVLSHMSDAERKDAYQGHIVYGTLRELGFDFLRDNLRYSKDETVQGPLDVAIVDEADQALIDEARTPLIIAGGGTRNGRSVHKVREAVEELMARQDRVVLGLREKVRGFGGDVRGQVGPFAALLVADPEDSELVARLAAEPRLRRRVQAEADAILTEESRKTLAGDLDYFIDARCDQVTLTDAGHGFMERRLGSIFDTTVLEKRLELNESNVDKKPLAERRRERDTLRRQISRRHNRMNQVHQMLRACILLKRDVDYIVTEGKVVLIDRVTGRRRPDSRYQHGLQAALESKERVTVHSEPDVLAEISIQGFMKQYAHVAGMTGTAVSAGDEFRYAYGLDVVAVPPTRPSRRHDYPARLYASRREKLMAVLEEVRRCRRVGRPVLVGARTVEQSKEISRLLDRDGVAHRLLNAVNNAEEAHVVKSAGTLGAVTVATNMAGRGTDIVLGPGLDQEITQRYATLVKELLDGGAGQIVLSCASADEADALVSVLSAFDGVSVATEERNGSTEVRVRPTHSPGRGGETVRMEFELGLHVVGTEMGESGRIDRQLRGRSGRQGENGSSRFFLSMEDHALMNGAGRGKSGSGEMNSDVFGSGFLEGIGTGRRLREVQDIAEREDEVSRAATWDYNQVIERQTLGFYRVRRDVIDADGFLGACAGFMRGKARRLVDQHLPPAMIGRYPSQFERIAEEAWLDYRVDCQPLFGLGIDALKEALAELMVAGLEEAAARHGSPEIDRVAKLLYLQTCNELWVDHLSRLQDLMLGSQLCGLGHKAAVADYLFQSIGMEQRFSEEVLDIFLPRLLAFEPRGEPVPQADPVSVVEDVQQILV